MANDLQIGEIVSGAQQRQLDPFAVIAVAQQEGLGGGIGDNGTSFGPWQLHVGGAFPQSVWDQVGRDPQRANAWAWSPAGIGYALDRMATVARGERGPAAVTAIVSRFERPADPSHEIGGATNTYLGLYRSTLGRAESIDSKITAPAHIGLPGNPLGHGNILGFGGGPASNLVRDVKKPIDAALAIPDFLGKLTDVHNILRGLQVVAGAVLVLVGVVLLARQVGLAADVPAPSNLPVPSVE